MEKDYVDSSGSRLRSVSAGIAVSQRKVHQISDPVQQILVVLHKIIFSTQLPPALQCNSKRRIVERFKKSLFNRKSNPYKLKSEIKMCDAAKLIEPNIFTADRHGVQLSSGGNMLLPDDRKSILGTRGMAEGMTYEQLQTLIEDVLEEKGYCSFSSYRYLYYPEGNKELFSKRRECVVLNRGFGIVLNEFNLPVLQQRLITKGSSFAH